MSLLQNIVLISAAAAGAGYLLNVIIKVTKTWYRFVDDWYGNDDIQA
jgi:hypothetical protein